MTAPFRYIIQHFRLKYEIHSLTPLRSCWSGTNRYPVASMVVGEPAEFIPGLPSQRHFFFYSSSPGAKWAAYSHFSFDVVSISTWHVEHYFYLCGPYLLLGMFLGFVKFVVKQVLSKTYFVYFIVDTRN